MITNDCMVLVGVRSWERRKEGKKEKADLLYVYSSGQLERLKNESKINYDILPDSVVVQDNDDSGFVFTNNETWEDKLGEIEVTNVKQNLKLSASSESKKNDDDDEFDFDDI